jgi:hypothetical protein
MVLTIVGCAEDSTSPPATGQSAAPKPPVLDAHRLAKDGQAIIGPQGGRVPIDPKKVTGFVDAATPNGNYVDLNGWVAVRDLSAPADGVVAIAGNTSVAVVPTIDRPDVVDGYNQTGLLHSGYGMSVPVSALDCSKPNQGLKTFAVTKEAAGPLEWLGNVDKIVRDACGGQ